MAHIDVDTSDAEPLREAFIAIPPGEYQLYMESSEVASTSTGNQMLKCVFAVATGQYEGTKVFCNFNLWNTNQKAVDIAKSQWRALCEATLGQPNALNNESSSLHNRIFIGELSNVPQQIKNDKGEYVDNPDPTKRRNELVFRKGTIRDPKTGIKQPPAATTAPVQTAGVAAQPNTTQAKPTTQPVTPGSGPAPWDRK